MTQHWTPNVVLEETGAVVTTPLLELLDSNGDPTPTVDLPGVGTYSISDGQFVFTPETGYVGTPTPVEYRATAAGGLTATGSYAPLVLVAPIPLLADNGATSALLNIVQTWTPTVTVTVTGEPLVSPILELLDANGDPTGSVNLPGVGDYTLVDGIVIFTPETDYVGTPTPVSYRGSDAVGNTATGTYAPVVLGIAIATENGATTALVNITQTWTPTVTIAGTGDVTTAVLIELLDANGDPTVTVDIPGVGVYSVADGALIFTPTQGYVGTPTPAQYRATDAFGMTATGTYAPVVTLAVVTPSPTPVTTLATTGGDIAGIALGSAGLGLVLLGAIAFGLRRLAVFAMPTN